MGAMRFRSKNDQRCSGRSGERMGGWGQPGVQEAIPRQSAGFLALLPGAFENVVPELAQLDAQGVAAMDQGTSQSVPPLLEHPAELLETDFAAMLLPAERARVRVPPEDEDGGEQACPDFTLHAARVGTFGDIQAQDPFALAEDEFNLPAEAVEVTEHGAGQFSGGRMGDQDEPAGQLQGGGCGGASLFALGFAQTGPLPAGTLRAQAKGHHSHRSKAVRVLAAVELVPLDLRLGAGCQRLGQIQAQEQARRS